MKLPVYLLITISLLLAVSCDQNRKDAESKKDKPPVMVDVIVAGNQEFPSDIQVNGTVLSVEMIELHPEVSGRLTYLNIPDGAFVQKGTVLARINDADLQAQMQQQKVQLELAQKTEQRLRQLLAVNGIDQSAYDAALSQVNLYKANIEVLNAQIDKTVIRAAFAGKLGLRMVSQGAYVTPSTAIGTLQQTDRVKIDFSVPEAYKRLVNPGKTIRVQPAHGEQEYKATISAIEPQISISTRNLKVRALLAGANLSPGAFVKVLLGEKVTGILVPSNAVIPDALTSQVAIIKKGKAVIQPVETGMRSADFVEITGGLSEGDSVVVYGVLFARPNSPVKIRKVIEFVPSQKVQF